MSSTSSYIQLLRNIKKTFGTQFYDNLQMTFDKDRPTETQHAEEDDPNDKENIVTNNEYEIEEILQKNRNRLKLARKRIIEKLQF